MNSNYSQKYIDELIDEAKQFDFELVWHKPANCLLRFERDDFRIDVWYSTSTVGIMQRQRRDRYKYRVSRENLIEIFANPSK